MTKVTLASIIRYLEMELELFEMDFNLVQDGKDYGKIAKILHKHYSEILYMLKLVKAGKKR